MKKRVPVVVALAAILAAVLAIAAFSFGLETPVLKEGEQYHIAGVSFYFDQTIHDERHFDSQDLDAMGEQWNELEAKLLADLSACTQRRTTELLFQKTVSLPDWLQLRVVLASDGGDPFTLLLGDGICQRRSFSFGPPVYIISGGEALCDQWRDVLQPLLQ